MIKLLLAWMAYGALAALWYKYYSKTQTNTKLLAAVGAAASLVITGGIYSLTELLAGIQALIGFAASVAVVFVIDRTVLKKKADNGKNN